MENSLSKWASLGVAVDGKIDSLQDPEELMIESLNNLQAEERLLSVLVTWMSQYGHLLITKKIKFHNLENKRLFYAIAETSQNPSLKIKSKISRNPSCIFISITHRNPKKNG